MNERVKIFVTVPEENLEELRRAMGDAGAGRIGNYTHCSFVVSGTGFFRPGEGSNPAIGEQGKEEVVKEVKIEMVCDRADAKNVIKTIRQTHPYEEPAIDIFPLIGEGELDGQM